MNPQRTRLALNTGNLLELCGAGLGCYAIARLVGVSWALVAGAVLLISGAELVYSGHVLRIPLPLKPHLLAKARRLLAWARKAIKR